MKILILILAGGGIFRHISSGDQGAQGFKIKTGYFLNLYFFF